MHVSPGSSEIEGNCLSPCRPELSLYIRWVFSQSDTENLFIENPSAWLDNFQVWMRVNMYGWYWCDTLGRLSESSISNALKLLHWFCSVTACGWDSLLVAPSSLFASSYFYCFCTTTTSSFWSFSRIQPFSFPYYPFCHSERLKEKEGEGSQRERETVIRLGENSQSPSQRTIRLFPTSPRL